MVTRTRLSGAASLLCRSIRSSPPSRSLPANQPLSSGWQARTGMPVVGRRTPVRLTFFSARVLTNVDLPAPVEPAMTISAGAALTRTLGST
ncbi:hypothetical protein ACFQGX_27255 [Nonomuraea dietziae]|uniref:hypothetical protein n=1 Tax=Nonomuraea dietziae TaxID=65515 RepID=UPI0036128250